MILGIDNFEQFKIFFDVIYDITEYVELQLFKDKVMCSILDKAHTRFMTATYQKEFFSVYEVDEAESVTLFAEDLHKIIKSVNKVDSVTMETNENYMVCKVESVNGNFRAFEFVLPSEHIESPQPPSISMPIRFDLNLSVLYQGCKDLGFIGSREIQFDIIDGTLVVTAGIEVSTKYSSTIRINPIGDGVVSSRYTLDYIEQLLKFEKINKTVEFKMGDNYPLLYSFKDDAMGVEVNGLIAPRLEIDD